MSEEELYLFDTMGFLRVRNVLDKATVAQTLEHSMGGIASGAFDDLRRSPPGQNPGGDFYDNAFLRDKVIERIARQPTMMDYGKQRCARVVSLARCAVLLGGVESKRRKEEVARRDE